MVKTVLIISVMCVSEGNLAEDCLPTPKFCKKKMKKEITRKERIWPKKHMLQYTNTVNIYR